MIMVLILIMTKYDKNILWFFVKKIKIYPFFTLTWQKEANQNGNWPTFNLLTVGCPFWPAWSWYIHFHSRPVPFYTIGKRDPRLLVIPGSRLRVQRPTRLTECWISSITDIQDEGEKASIIRPAAIWEDRSLIFWPVWHCIDPGKETIVGGFVCAWIEFVFFFPVTSGNCRPTVANDM